MSNSTALQTYQAIGNREDLEDIITNLSPDETPMFQAFGKTKATSTLHEWLTDTLTAGSAGNGQIEGGDYVFTRAGSRTRLGNRTQLFVRTVEVSHTQRAVNPAGVNDEFEYQLMKSMKTLKMDIEAAIASTASSASGASGTARTMQGAYAFITSNTASASATGLALNETDFNGLLQTIWTTAGTHGGTVYAAGFNKRRISQFVGNATKYFQSSEKEAINAIDVYQSDFGTFHVVLHRYTPTSYVGVFDNDKWKIAQLMAPKRVDVATVGSADRAAIEAEVTLVALNEASSGKFTGTTTS
jgi:hypothetical protein